MLLLTKTHPEILRLRQLHGPNIGRLVTPRQNSSLEATAAAGIPWAIDNDAFNGFDEARFVALIARAGGLPGCEFVVAPDVVGDAAATLELYRDWYAKISVAALPPALAAQDGLTPRRVPWRSISALFIGGSTDWKLGAAAARLAAEAERRGLWLHVGRVNSVKRARYARSIGAASIDGSGFSRFCNTHAHLIADLLAESRQLPLQEATA